MPEKDPNVEYREIPGYPGYFAGSDGSIWSDSVSAGRVLGRIKIGKPYKQLKQQTIQPTKRYPRNKPYCWVGIGSTKQRRIKLVHVLVLEAFVGPCPHGMECRHGDGNVGNNRITNLQWGTKKENWQDKHNHGTAPVGRKSGTAKANEDIVREIRRLKATHTYNQLVAMFGLKFGSVRAIVGRRTWKHVK